MSQYKIDELHCRNINVNILFAFCECMHNERDKSRKQCSSNEIDGCIYSCICLYANSYITPYELTREKQKRKYEYQYV